MTYGGSTRGFHSSNLAWEPPEFSINHNPEDIKTPFKKRIGIYCPKILNNEFSPHPYELVLAAGLKLMLNE
jgi:hypothetical protein